MFLRNLESENDLRGKLACRKCFNGLFCFMEFVTLKIWVARANGTKSVLKSTVSLPNIVKYVFRWINNSEN